MVTPGDLRKCACWPLNISSQFIYEKKTVKHLIILLYIMSSRMVVFRKGLTVSWPPKLRSLWERVSQTQEKWNVCLK